MTAVFILKNVFNLPHKNKIMKIILTLIILMFCSAFFAQKTHTSTVNGHVFIFEELPNNLGLGKANRLSLVLNNYLEAIVKGDYDLWYAQLSDSTKSRVLPVKFPKKFERLEGYKVQQLDTVYVEIMDVVEGKLKTNEAGDLYNVVLRFQSPLMVGNRVSFDFLKRKEVNEMSKYKLGINISITEAKVFHVFFHKYNDSGNKRK